MCKSTNHLPNSPDNRMPGHNLNHTLTQTTTLTILQQLQNYHFFKPDTLTSTATTPNPFPPPRILRRIINPCRGDKAPNPRGPDQTGRRRRSRQPQGRLLTRSIRRKDPAGSPGDDKRIRAALCRGAIRLPSPRLRARRRLITNFHYY